MSPKNDPHALAEMFADMADVFSDSVDHDGLSTLLTYCLETSGIISGVAMLLGEGLQPTLIFGSNGPVDPASYVMPPIVARSVRTLHAEVSITADAQDVTREFAFPLRVRGTALGAVHLFGAQSHTVDDEDLALLQSIADIAATTIDQTHRLQQTRALVSQLQGALDSRVVVEQAKGILAARQQTDVSRAFNEIRSIARREQRPVRAVASEIVSSVSNQGTTFPDLMTEN
jgi:ANTAR domain/GAF domain